MNGGVVSQSLTCLLYEIEVMQNVYKQNENDIRRKGSGRTISSLEFAFT